MSKTMPVSNSSIQTFKECRRRWWLGYYRGLRPRTQDFTGPLALGSRVHAALETHHRDGVPLLAEWDRLCEEDRLKMASALRSTDELDSEAELGRIMLEGYLQWSAETGLDSDLELISAEEVLTFPLFDGRVELRGKLDQRVLRRSDGTRFIRDWKTTAGFADVSRLAHINEQFKTYQLLEMLKEGGTNTVAGSLIVMLRKVKRTAAARPPFYEQLEVRHNIFTIRNYWDRLHGVISDMLAVRDALAAGADPNVVAYPRPSRECTWKCPFFAVCPLFDDGSAAEQAVETLYTTGDPFDYYPTNDDSTTT